MTTDSDWLDLATHLHILDHLNPTELTALSARAAALVEGLGLTPERLAHTLAVGRRCAALAEGRDAVWGARAELAGTLHDVGYAHPVTGMHAVDGAAWLDGLGFPSWVVAAVAHHSTAHWECAARRISNPWPAPEQDLADLLWVADFTTTPTGAPTTLVERVDEIRSRYPADSEVVAALDAAASAQREAADRLASWSRAWAAEHHQGK